MRYRSLPARHAVVARSGGGGGVEDDGNENNKENNDNDGRDPNCYWVIVRVQRQV